MIAPRTWSTLVVSALLMAGCGTADVTSQGTSTSGAGNPRSVSEGAPVTQTVPSAEVSAAPVNAAAARVGNAPVAAPGVPPTVPRAIPRLRGPRPVALPSPFDPIPPAGVDASGSRQFTAGPVPLAAGGPAPRAPALSASFIGLVDDGMRIPPDTMGAAGPDHLVSFLNSEVGFFTKTGGPPVSRTTLSGFWAPLISANTLPNNVFDPKVIYDASSGRFIAVTLDGRLPDTGSSWVLLAVSRTSDPTAGWSTWALPADNTGATWADYPGLGVDDNHVYVTASLFDAADSFRQSRIWRIPKAQLLTLPQATTLTRTEFTHPAFNLQPAHTFGAATVEHLLTESDLIDGNGRRFRLEVFSLSGPTLSSLGTVQVSPYPIVDDTRPFPPAPQDRIDTGDTRILSVIQRNGRLYTTHTVSDLFNAKTEVAWYEIVPSSPPSLAQQGRISDPDRFYYYPSIAVNANGDIALGFSGSSSSPIEYAGGYFTARRNGDAPGTTQAVGLLKAGEASYFKTLAGTSNRWGDFSATVVDPNDDLTFWTLQEYARTGNQWGTWWGSFRTSDILSPDAVVATPDNLAVRLTWNDRATNEINYVVERKAGAGGAFAVLTIPSLPANSTSYTDNSGMAPGTVYFYRVGAVGALGTAYADEVQVGTSPPPSSGGGAGCLTITRSGGGPPFAASPTSVGFLLLPAAALVLRRCFHRFARKRTFRHSAC